ncbi:MAG: type VI secretion system baseplate subunit TssG [Gammaproteobacteria bacterium]
MADPPGTPAGAVDDLIEALAREPWRFGFLSALRRLAAAHPEKPRPGESQRPLEDPIRLAQQPSLIFAPSTLASFTRGQDGRPPRMEVFFLGLFGPNGPLPIHLTEYARDRLRNAGDPTLSRFADLFHHRVLSLFYRAWAAAHPAANFDRPHSDRYATFVGSLIGVGRPVFRNRDAMADEAKYYYAGRISAQTRNAEGLGAILASYFKVPVRVVERIGEWINVPAGGLSSLGGRSDVSTLGLNIIIGTRIWEVQQKFRIEIGPVGYADYQRLLPGGDSLRRMVAIVRNYVGDELNWDVQIKLKRQEVPAPRLGEHVRLGWTTWFASRPFEHDAADLYLNPLAFISTSG